LTEVAKAISGQAEEMEAVEEERKRFRHRGTAVRRVDGGFDQRRCEVFDTPQEGIRVKLTVAEFSTPALQNPKIQP
jgi:hypothetical protein